MNHITRFLDKYKGMKPLDMIADPDLTRDIATLNKGDINQSSELKTFFTNLMIETQKDIQNLQSQMGEEKKDMDQMQKNIQACLAYLKPDQGGGS